MLLENAVEEAPVSGYDAMNALWGCKRQDIRKLSDREALKACRLLLAEGFRAFGSGPRDPRVKQKRKFKIISRGATWPRGGVWEVNPNEANMGLSEIIHSVSHWVHNVCNPGLSRKRGGGHEGHLLVERHLVEYAIKRRWHIDGLPLRPLKDRPPMNARAVRYARVLARIKTWEAKAKRAATALKKLKLTKRYYERLGVS